MEFLKLWKMVTFRRGKSEKERKTEKKNFFPSFFLFYFLFFPLLFLSEIASGLRLGNSQYVQRLEEEEKIVMIVP